MKETRVPGHRNARPGPNKYESRSQASQIRGWIRYMWYNILIWRWTKLTFTLYPFWLGL